MKGRPRKPREQRILEGNPSRRPLPPEIKIDPLCEPSPHLSDDAKEIWRELMSIPQMSKVCKVTDRHAFDILCARIAGYRKFEQYCADIAIVTEDHIDMFKECRSQADAIYRMFSRFGLTPADRTRVMQGDPEPLDEFEAFLKNNPSVTPTGKRPKAN